MRAIGHRGYGRLRRLGGRIVVRRALLVMAVVVAAVGLVPGTASAKTAHCDGHTVAPKVEGEGTFVVGDIVVTVDGPTVTFTDAYGDPVIVDYCIKASTRVGSGTGSEATVWWLNGGGQTPDISYVVVYGVDDDHEGCHYNGETREWECPLP
jgi:hypothetical protein